MTERILNVLSDIEKKHDITILYAIEAGSRIWGYASDISDYDIRFIYVHNDISEYLSIYEKKQTIESTINDPDIVLDIVGFDIQKVAHLVTKNNPSLFEWLSSPMVYINNGVIDEIKDLVMNNINHIAIFYHYKNIFVSLIKHDLALKPTTKKYLHIIKSYLLLKDIIDQEYPIKLITDMNELITKYADIMGQEVTTIIKSMIDKKKNGINEEGTNTTINEWLDHCFDDILEIERNLKKNTENKKVNYNMISKQIILSHNNIKPKNINTTSNYYS